MSNPSIAQLINPAPLVEQGLKARFDVQIKGLPCFLPRSVPVLPAKFITVQFTLGPALDHLRPMPDGTFQRDAWKYQITVVVQTVRAKDGQGAPLPDEHAPAVGQAIALVTAARYDSGFLPWHVLTTLELQGQTESVRTSDDSDLSTINFAGMICVKPEAWPTQ